MMIRLMHFSALIVFSGLIAPAFAAAQQAAPAKPVVVDPQTAASFAGKYAILRDAKTPSTCTLVLVAGKPSAKGNMKASLQSGCADKGMGIFNPVGWRLEGDKLFLVAKRGYETSLLRQSDGTYSKDKAIKGAMPLVLRKF